MKVAIALCIILVVINSVYNEDPSINDSSLSRETRNASPARKDSKVSRKDKKKQRKMKKKNGMKIKEKKITKNTNKAKKAKTNSKDKAKKKTGRKKNKSKGGKIKRKSKKGKKMKRKNKKGKKFNKKDKKRRNGKNRKGKKKFNKRKKNTKRRKNQGTKKVKISNVLKANRDNSSSTESATPPKKLTCDPPNTKAVNNFKQNRRFYDKYNLLANKLEKISVFKSYASLLGKITNDGLTCTEAAKAGYLLMNGCETSAAAACNNTEFTANYTTAIGCTQIINCNTTKIPDECKIKTKLDEIVDKTKECTNKKIPGTFTYCMSYIKENVSTVVGECLDQILVETTSTATTTETTTESTGSTQPPATIDTSTIFTEGDEIVEQKESYNPESKEMTLSVPAHGNNVALKAIIGVDQMVTSYDNYCVVGDSPADYTTEVSERSSRSNVDEVNSASVVKVYSFNVVEGDMTDAERAELPESFRNACKDKPIQKTRRVVVDEATFNQDSLDSVVTRRIKPDEMNSVQGSWDSDEAGRGRTSPKDMQFRIATWDLGLGLAKTSRQDNCSSQKTSCSKFDKGCYFSWANPDGSTVKVHSIPKTVQCLSCCENQTTSTLCQCSEINSGSKWKSCYKKTNGDCGFNGWQCNSTETCLEYSEQCDGECYGSLNKCGEKCVVPLEPGASSYEYMCQDQCIDNTVTCEGSCPASDPVKCGQSCLTNVTANYYYECDGKCISRGKPCNGECAEGYIDCTDYDYYYYYNDNGGFCGSEKYYYECNGTCTSKYRPCNGECSEGWLNCGSFCGNEEYYYDCNGECSSKYYPCDGECFEGLAECDGRCYTQSYIDKYYYDCNGECTNKYYPCDGECVEGYAQCNQYCYPQDTFDTYYYYCGSQCLSKNQQCDGTCLEGTTKCGDNMCLCSDDDPNCYYNSNNFRDCNGTCTPSWYPCDKTCVSGYNYCNYTYGSDSQYGYERCIEESYFNDNYKYCNDCYQCTWANNECPSQQNSTCQPDTSTLSTPSTSAAPATPVVTGRARKRTFYH